METVTGSGIFSVDLNISVSYMTIVWTIDGAIDWTIFWIID